MRLLLASVATLAAVALAAPAFAQDAAPAAPAATPTPSTTIKHKPAAGTAAYCNTLKTATSKSACLKRVHAQNVTPKAGTTHKKTKKVDATKTDTSASAAPAPTAAPSSPQTINVPPLPQKTI